MSNGSELTHEDVVRILQIVDEASDVEVHVEIDGLKLHVQKSSVGRPAAAPAAAPLGAVEPPAAQASLEAPAPSAPAPAPIPEPVPVSEPAASAAPAPGTELIRAPMLGRFFRAPSPLEAPYVEVGAEIGADDPVCLLEVMKVFNTVRAGLSGRIVEVLVEDQDMVEQDQPLFVIKTG